MCIASAGACVGMYMEDRNQCRMSYITTSLLLLLLFLLWLGLFISLIFISPLRILYNVFWLYSQLIPESILPPYIPIFLYSFFVCLFLNSLSPGGALFIFLDLWPSCQVWPIYLGATCLEKIGFPSPSSYQLPIVPHFGGGVRVHLSSMVLSFVFFWLNFVYGASTIMSSHVQLPCCAQTTLFP